MTLKLKGEISRGLAALGIKSRDVNLNLSGDRIVVIVNGEYFGLWDTRKATFVD